MLQVDRASGVSSVVVEISSGDTPFETLLRSRSAMLAGSGAPSRSPSGVLIYVYIYIYIYIHIHHTYTYVYIRKRCT